MTPREKADAIATRIAHHPKCPYEYAWDVAGTEIAPSASCECPAAWPRRVCAECDWNPTQHRTTCRSYAGPPPIERIKAKTTYEPGGCWIFTGATKSDGYGTIRDKDKTVTVHRVSWLAHNGPIPINRQVLHRCDRPACWNPDHLFLGTHQDNMRDRQQKRRMPYGERGPSAKLTYEKVATIRTLLSSGRSANSLAKEYGVAAQTIDAIRDRRTWK